MSSGVGYRCGSDPELLWLWHRPAATAPIRLLAWESKCAVGVAQEMAKRPKKKKTKKKKQTVLCVTSVTFLLNIQCSQILCRSFKNNICSLFLFEL